MISMRPEIVLRTEQKLSPRMIQTLEILQLPQVDLQAKIEKEMQENPVLEYGEIGRDEMISPEVSTIEDKPFDPEGPLVHDADNAYDFQRLDAIDRDWDGHFNEEHRVSRSQMQEDGDKSLDAMQNITSREVSLQEYLTEQMTLLDLTPEVLERILFIIDHLDLGDEAHPGNGYLKTPLQQLADTCPVASTLTCMEQALAILQKLDPPGIGARDLKECLLLQVTPEMEMRDAVRILITNHLEDIQFNRIPLIQKKTGLDMEEITEAIEVIRHLDPKPASRFTQEATHYVTPDIIVERNEAGEYVIRLTDDWLPELRISPKYLQMYKNKQEDGNTRKYLREKIQKADWLRDAIQQRRNTLEKVTRAIIDHQRGFLDKGPEHIQPLKMQQIADQVGVHVTTVSRAVDNKWVETPRGVFPLKRFFVGGKTNDQTGQDFAWEKVRQQLLSFIADEDKTKPLSDDDIVEKFAKAGYEVARRTVTKYRKLLNIPSSRQRKNWASVGS